MQHLLQLLRVIQEGSRSILLHYTEFKKINGTMPAKDED